MMTKYISLNSTKAVFLVASSWYPRENVTGCYEETAAVEFKLILAVPIILAVSGKQVKRINSNKLHCSLGIHDTQW